MTRKRISLKSNIHPSHIPITIVCLCFGGIVAFLLSANMSNNKREVTQNISQMNRDQLVALYIKTADENAKLKAENEQLNTQFNNLVDGTIDNPEIQKQFNELRILSGTTALQGPGITITLDDTKNSLNPADPEAILKIVHDSDLYTLVNELKASGAEAIEINGQRIIATSAIRCAGPSILANNTQIAPPFVINAIGDADTLFGSINLPAGTLDWLRSMSIEVKVEKKKELTISAIKVKPTLTHAEVVLDTKGN